MSLIRGLSGVAVWSAGTPVVDPPSCMFKEQSHSSCFAADPERDKYWPAGSSRCCVQSEVKSLSTNVSVISPRSSPRSVFQHKGQPFSCNFNWTSQLKERHEFVVHRLHRTWWLNLKMMTQPKVPFASDNSVTFSAHSKESRGVGDRNVTWNIMPSNSYTAFKPFLCLSSLLCAHQRETPIQYPCCSRERLWVVVNLKRRYRNGQSEWICVNTFPHS